MHGAPQQQACRMDFTGMHVQGPDILAPRAVIHLPDAAGIMASSASLHFNDAPWLAEGSGLRLAHPDVPLAVAERLGARSLRYQHQVGCLLDAGGYCCMPHCTL